MKVLLIGDNPAITGGVCNYTRPIFNQLSKDLNIQYLYSSSNQKPDYDFTFKTKICVDKDFNDKGNVFKIVNSANLTHNYHNLQLDIESKKNDREFENFIKREKPDIIHIHEIIGFSSKIISIAKKYRIKVIHTVHEYWYLCSHRVMVDFNKRICEGPTDFDKCAYCVNNVKKGIKNHSYQKFIYRMKNFSPFLLDILVQIKNLFLKKDKSIKKMNLNFDNIDYTKHKDSTMKEVLNRRFDLNIKALNMSDKIIGVSSSVKETLLSFGVLEEKIIVQPIGSTIANSKIVHTKKVKKEEIVFGFIGGVGYYKGVHQLVEAFLLMPKSYQQKSKIKIFGGGNSNYIDTIKDSINKKSDCKNKIIFYGRYKHEDIPKITNRVDISVLPSLCADTAPQTIFESFSASLPIIAPDVGGFPDFIENNINGLIYKKASSEDLSKKMMYLIDNPNLCNEFSKNIPQMKTIQQNGKELISLYKSIYNS